jgi:hypothetical protein
LVLCESAPPRFVFELCEPIDFWVKQSSLAQFLSEQYERAALEKETPTLTRFKFYIHWDLVYRSSSAGSESQAIWGLGGVHMCFIELSERLQLCPVGVQMFMYPGADGGRKIAPGPTMGLSLRVKDFFMPITNTKSTLYFNLAKAWVTIESPSANLPAQQGQIDVMGISLTFMK